METRSPSIDHEPFGQRGVSSYLWPVFVILCAVGLCTCVIMNQRSWTNWDSITNTSATRQVRVASVIGRIVVDINPVGLGLDATASEWRFDSDLFDTVEDGWQASWRKVLGVEWGMESARRFGGQPYTYWRLRIRWRTLAILYLVPVLIELVRRFRARRARQRAGELVAA